MSDAATTTTSGNLIDRLSGLVEPVSHMIVLLAVRWMVATPFWNSYNAKKTGLLSMQEFQVDLFRDEFGMPFPWLSAHASFYAEFFLAIALFIGLGTRIAATGLLIMTMVIQVYVFDKADPHFLWALALIFLIYKGAGALSLDTLIEKYRSK